MGTFYQAIRDRFSWLAHRPGWAFFLPFALVLIGRLILLHQIPPATPIIQDEFSYLLAGQTFASFHWTNPPHPLWPHFETIHELMQPTYMSKYPPMQGLVLAFGQLAFDSPWLGIIFNMALFCGLLPWVFRAWLSAEWALLGALLATYKIGILSYWTETYWGGGAAALGGALVLGTTLRLVRQSEPKMAAVFTFGAGILANSRPFEGAVFVFLCGIYLLISWFAAGRWKTTWPQFPLQFFPTASLVALPIIVAMGTYNARVTGHVFEMPYVAYEKQYAVASAFFWQQDRPHLPLYRHEFIKREWIDWDLRMKKKWQENWPRVYVDNFIQSSMFYLGPVFLAGGFFLILALFHRPNWPLLILLVLFLLGIRVNIYLIPHYLAPATALIYLAATAALQTTWQFAHQGRPLGAHLCLYFIILFLISTTVGFIREENRYLYYKPRLIAKRQQVLNFFAQLPGQQLVFVHYGPHLDLNTVWTFNDADIDASRLIWVNSMSPAEDQAVLDYYHTQNRTVWLLDDDVKLQLYRYDQPHAAPLLEIENPVDSE